MIFIVDLNRANPERGSVSCGQGRVNTLIFLWMSYMNDPLPSITQLRHFSLPCIPCFFLGIKVQECI